MIGFYHGTVVPSDNANEGIYFINSNNKYSIYTKVNNKSAEIYAELNEVTSQDIANLWNRIGQDFVATKEQIDELNTNLDNKVSSITITGNQIYYYTDPQGEAYVTGTLMNATTSEPGFMSAADKTKLDGIAEGANAYTLPAATSSTLGGVKIGSNITNSNGTISLTSSNVTTALGYTPATQDYVTEQIQAAIQASWEASY